MTLREQLTKPEYLFQPSRLLRRIARRTTPRGADGSYVLRLPWGVCLRVQRMDDIGRAVDTFGVFDLVVTEAVWRLLQPGDTALDVGANVGYMSLVMMARLKTRGRVFAFEPHPGLFDDLKRNVADALLRLGPVDVQVRPEGLSDVSGTAALFVPNGFENNRGLARIYAAGRGIPISVCRLDDMATEIGADVRLMKIDVEGHEASALRGATALLEGGVIRNGIIEEHAPYPTEATSLLERYGYKLFSLERALFGARLGDAARPHRTSWEAPSLLATRESQSAIEAFRRPGWRCLST